MIVLPHSGPASNDTLSFDWLAQFLASRGYVLLQPQFLGSEGFGRNFRRKGYGEWGKKMSTDLDDGVVWLAETGLVDPNRVCVIGTGYGGYAALAAAAFSDISYKCVVSVGVPAICERWLSG